MKVGEAEDGDRAYQSGHAQDHERGLERQQVELEDDEDECKSGEGAGLAEGRHAPKNGAAPVLGRQVHAEGVLSLKDGVEAEACDENPGDDRPKTGRQREQGVADTKSHKRPRRDVLQGHPVEHGSQEDEDEAAHLADGRDVAELGP